MYVQFQQFKPIAAAVVTTIAILAAFQVTPAAAQRTVFAEADCSDLLSRKQQLADDVSVRFANYYNAEQQGPADSPAVKNALDNLQRFQALLDRARQDYDECKRKQQEARREKLQLLDQQIQALLDLLALAESPEDELRRAGLIPEDEVVRRGIADVPESGNKTRTRQRVKRETTGSGNVGDVPEGRKKDRARAQVKDEGPKGGHDDRASDIGAELFGAAIGIGMESLGRRGSGGGHRGSGVGSHSDSAPGKSSTGSKCSGGKCY